MLYPFIVLFTYSFDLFIIYTYLNNTLTKHRDFSHMAFFSCFILTECALFANESLTASLPDGMQFVITISISLATTFALTFLYEAGMSERFFVSVSFQILALFGEYIFAYVMQLIRPQIFSDFTPLLNAYMNLGSKIILFFLVLIFSVFLGKNFHFANNGQAYLLFSTPLASLAIIFFTPLEKVTRDSNHVFYLCIYICLAVLNITNYIFLDHMNQQTQEMLRLKQMEQLAAFQQEKYAQLGAAYKANRGLVHDTKKHYFVIRKYLENKEYQKLEAYLDISLDGLENAYSEVNTGNLVIDSFVTSYKNLCHESMVSFETDILCRLAHYPAGKTMKYTIIY